MTAASVTMDPVAPSQATEWRVRLAEFLAVGGATLVLFPVAWSCRAVFGLDAAELGAGFLTFCAAFVLNDPHFSITYLLFYRNVKRRAFGDAFVPAQRVRYLVAGFVVPLLLAVWIVAALTTQSARGLGFLMELMFWLVGWHYVKQGFGVFVVLSARRGMQLSGLERKVVLAHCFAGWAYAWASPSTASKEVEEKGVVYTALAHPPSLEIVSGVLFILSAVALLWVLARKWRTERRFPPLAPMSGLLITVWLWTVYSSLDPLMVYAIPALHSVQYLYFVWLLKRNESRAEEGPPSFGRPTNVRLGVLAMSALALGWILFHGAPEFLDGIWLTRATMSSADATLGQTPFFAALFAFVNVHHYFMDYVIWRRENPDTRFLRH